jgi:hypothetical protein
MQADLIHRTTGQKNTHPPLQQVLRDALAIQASLGDQSFTRSGQAGAW